MTPWARVLAAVIILGGGAALCFRGGDVRAGSRVGLVMVPDAAAVPWTARPWLPEQVGSWVGQPVEISSNELEILPSDTQFARVTYQAEGEPFPITSSIVLSGTSRGSIHRAEFCMKGQGWTATATPFPVRLSTGRTMDATLLDMTRPVMQEGREVTVRGMYVYWFVGADRVTSSHVERLLATAWSRLLRGENQRWAYVIAVVTYVDDRNPETNQKVRRSLERFLSEAVPRFQRAGI